MASYAALVKESLEKLWPQDAEKYQYELKYSGKFSGYNGNIRLRNSVIVMRMSKEWRGVSKEIQIGLIQELLVRLFKRKAHTMNMDLYHMFLKRVHIAIPKDEQDEHLSSVFDHLNTTYLNSILERPNLRWGKDSTRKLGSYEFGTDTITISKILHPEQCADERLLKYVLYHEMLHKKFKFDSHAGHTRSHTAEFREWESRFPEAAHLEKQLSYVATKKRIAKSFKSRSFFGIKWP